MRRTRILVDADLQAGERITLPESATRHLVKVLRLRSGQEFIAFDGRNPREAVAVLEETGKKSATAKILAVTEVERESPLDLSLIQSISATDKMDYALQKAVELGVKRIIPVWSERSQRRLKPAQVEKKLRHWQGVITHATEQSGRTRLATLEQPSSLEGHVAQRDRKTAAIVLAPDANITLGDIEPPNRGMEIYIGPEGGFSKDELRMLAHAEVKPVRMGPRILRTETAGVAVLAWLQVQFGDA